MNKGSIEHDDTRIYIRKGANISEPYGYPISDGYLGYIKNENTMRLFSTEDDYYDYIGY